MTTVRILRERLTEPWTLNLLADEVHLSRSQLVRAFDATVGVAPAAYPRLMRVQGMAPVGVYGSLGSGDRTIGRLDGYELR